MVAGGRMVGFAGWEMPQQYSSVREEHSAVRHQAGVFDVSHMGRFSLRGPDVAAFLDRMVTNHAGRLEEGRALYSLMCGEDGGILDDLVIYRSPGGWSVVVNASNREADLSWLRAHAPPGLSIDDVTEEISLLALQGPNSESILPASETEKAALPYFGVGRARVAGVEMAIARTGYTGEDGFELFVPSEHAVSVWRALIAGGATACGLAARDACRLEAGLRLYGTDMDERTNPYDVGLGWTVGLDKGDFVGRDALLAVKREGPGRTMVGLRAEPRAIPRPGSTVRRAGADVGTVTSGTYSFSVGRGIGLVLARAGTLAPGDPVSVAGRTGDQPAEIVGLPFHRGSVRRQTATA